MTGLLSGNQHGHRSTHPRPRHNAEGFITHNDEFKKQAEDGSFLEEGGGRCVVSFFTYSPDFVRSRLMTE